MRMIAPSPSFVSVLRTAAIFGLAFSICAGRAQHVDAQSGPAADSLALAAPLPDSFLAVWGTDTLRPGAFAVGLSGSYARHPLTVAAGDEQVGYLIGSVTTFELLGTFGVVGPLDISAAIPMHVLSHGGGLNDEVREGLAGIALDEMKVSLGDIRVVPRLQLLQRVSMKGLGLAFLVPVWLPTGERAVYAGERVRAEPRLAIEEVTDGFSLGVNVGYRFRAKTTLLGARLDDLATWGAAASVRLVENWRLLVEISGGLNLKADDFSSKDAPTELLGAIRFSTERFIAQLGGGPGLLGGITEPSWRVLGAVALLPAQSPPADGDRDGLPDAEDKCPGEAEDQDGFRDDDGCPDPDNDMDGVADAVDRCPNQPEDPDGFEDQDGCPDPDNDQDRISDAEDACPTIPGLASKNRISNGCPDGDGDGIQDAQDACPTRAGVASDEPAKNGCPAVADRDGDGILDEDDACPEAAGPKSSDSTRSGCPIARVEAGQIKITERIEFLSGKAELAPSSMPTLQAVLKILESHPEITRLQVAGHTDARGDEGFNERLSRRRAESVKRWLVSHGVDAARLDAQGFGESRPIDTNETSEGRSANRRVEFHIQAG